MDAVDPLSEHQPPPRHILESDSEDEYLDDNQELAARFKVPQEPVKLPTFTLDLGDARSSKQVGNGNLLVVLGLAAVYWHALLETSGEIWSKLGSVKTDGAEIGSLFTHKSQPILLLVLPGTNTVPVIGYRSLAECLLGRTSPKRLAIIDSYPVPTYIDTSKPRSDALYDTIRYLSTSSLNVPDTADSLVESFAPPNLISSPTASLLSLLTLAYPSSQGISILLPNPHEQHVSSSFTESISPQPSITDPDSWPGIPSLIARGLDLAISALGISSSSLKTPDQFGIKMRGSSQPLADSLGRSALSSRNKPGFRGSIVGEGGIYL